MVLKSVNIEHKLQRLQQKNYNEYDILQEVNAILNEDSKIRERIVKTLKEPLTDLEGSNNFNSVLLEAKNIYHIDTIKTICISYRLRFLSSKHFKNSFPQEAISKIKYLEKKHETRLSDFKVMAPSKLFKLKNPDDPLLFVPLGGDYYYLIHKWGNDMHFLRKIAMLPFKTIENLLSSILVSSFILTAIFNYTSLTHGNSAQFWILFLFMFKSVMGIVIYYAFSRGKNVSSGIWNSTLSK